VFCLFLPVLVLVCIYASSGGDDFWENKNFSEWSQKEVQRLLEDSPWSKHFMMEQRSAIYLEPLEDSPRTAQIGDLSKTTELKPVITYNVQLRSAKPIQQAIIRQVQIKQKYDTLSPERKLKLENDVRDYLSATNPDEVIVCISIPFNDTTGAWNHYDYSHYWRTRTVDKLKNSVFLVVGEKGVKIPIKRFVLEKDFLQLERELIEKKHDRWATPMSLEFEFIFPRNVKGMEILGAGDQSFKLEFLHPLLDNAQVSRAFEQGNEGFLEFSKCSIEFNADKMKIQGKLVY
jgi:hypothetical protein